MKHMCEILSEQNTKKRFRVMYWDRNWCEVEHLRVEHARAEVAYAAVGTFLLAKIIGEPGLDVTVKELIKAESVTVEDADE